MATCTVCSRMFRLLKWLRGRINFKPPIIRLFTITILISTSFFFASEGHPMIGYIIFGGTCVLALVWLIRGPHEPTDDIKKTLGTIEQYMKDTKETNEQILKTMMEFVDEVRKDRVNGHGQQPTIDESEDM